ncbi:MAG: ZIP family metal transporter [Lachnospiraceae bacterium]|jgi:ZIP family zinc transporter|nr:ZIP family metal transporter [Lachnospiraceae bacterium]
MKIALIVAFSVGGATIFGVLLGFLFKNIPHKFHDAILGFAAGVMLGAAIIGLIQPSMEYGNIWVTLIGIVVGVVFLNLADKLTPHLHVITGMDKEKHREKQSHINKVMLFVMSIAIHNLPEGLAAGVGFGGGDLGDAITVALGIALQNIPEGMIIVSPLIIAGVPKLRVFLIASFTGIIEIFGTLVGYSAVSISTAILPFALAFAGGTMLYIISDEMIPDTHSHGFEKQATYSLIGGFMLMLVMNFYLG